MLVGKTAGQGQMVKEHAELAGQYQEEGVLPAETRDVVEVHPVTTSFVPNRDATGGMAEQLAQQVPGGEGVKRKLQELEKS